MLVVGGLFHLQIAAFLRVWCWDHSFFCSLLMRWNYEHFEIYNFAQNVVTAIPTGCQAIFLPRLTGEHRMPDCCRWQAPDRHPSVKLSVFSASIMDARYSSWFNNALFLSLHVSDMLSALKEARIGLPTSSITHGTIVIYCLDDIIFSIIVTCNGCCCFPTPIILLSSCYCCFLPVLLRNICSDL